ncbi:MAG: SDR family oxidoreductase [bacterium]|nr:SDR family oxidoreductase [bacterium]
MSLTGRIAVVTGAGSGLGRAGALALAAAGARVAVSDLRPDATEETAAAIRAAGGEAIAIPADAGDRAQAKRLVDETVARFGGLDVLYNNAGVAPVGRDGFVPAIDEDDWDWVIRTNLTSVYLCCKYAIPAMAGRPGAAIVNTASSMAVQPLGMMDAYAASKAGVAGLTRSLAPACGQLGIRVNAICPGYVDTPMNALIFGDETFKAAFARDHATGLQSVDEIADVVVFLASDAARSFTGAVLTCDRGWTAFKRPAALGTM